MHRVQVTTLLQQRKEPFGGQPERDLAPDMLLRDFPPCPRVTAMFLADDKLVPGKYCRLGGGDRVRSQAQ